MNGNFMKFPMGSRWWVEPSKKSWKNQLGSLTDFFLESGMAKDKSRNCQESNEHSSFSRVFQGISTFYVCSAWMGIAVACRHIEFPSWQFGMPPGCLRFRWDSMGFHGIPWGSRVLETCRTHFETLLLFSSCWLYMVIHCQPFGNAHVTQCYLLCIWSHLSTALTQHGLEAIDG